MDLRDRVAIVTGAGSGIGQASAIAMAAAGARALVLADLEPATETEAAVSSAGADAVSIVTDVGNALSLRALFDATQARFGRLDILHNNAGMGEGAAAWPETDPDRCAAICDVNLRAVVLGTRLALEPMKRSGGGAIVHTSSGAAFVPLPQQAVYAATKAGVVHFTRSCAPLVESHGVRVNCVCPGLVDTPMLLATGGGSVAGWLAPIVDAIELLRPDEVASAVLDLILDDSKVAEAVTVENRART